MNINELTIGEAKELAKMFGAGNPAQLDNGMIGKYVIVRCRDAGVHSGYLESHNGRECVLTESRRFWYWKPADKKSFLSGCATNGLHKDSKIGETVARIHLTENCEIVECSSKAERSIKEAPSYDQ